MRNGGVIDLVGGTAASGVRWLKSDESTKFCTIAGVAFVFFPVLIWPAIFLLRIFTALFLFRVNPCSSCSGDKRARQNLSQRKNFTAIKLQENEWKNAIRRIFLVSSVTTMVNNLFGIVLAGYQFNFCKLPRRSVRWYLLNLLELRPQVIMSHVCAHHWGHTTVSVSVNVDNTGSRIGQSQNTREGTFWHS